MHLSIVLILTKFQEGMELHKPQGKRAMKTHEINEIQWVHFHLKDGAMSSSLTLFYNLLKLLTAIEDPPLLAQTFGYFLLTRRQVLFFYPFFALSTN